MAKIKKNQMLTNLKLWHKSRSQIMTKLKKYGYLKTENPNLDMPKKTSQEKNYFGQ